MNVAERRTGHRIATWLDGHALSAGRPYPLGATIDDSGVNFAVFSAHAELIELCLFTDDGTVERARIPLRERDGDVWHVHVAGLGAGTAYGFRAHGPFAPERGHRFNPAKLLIDPYARQLLGDLDWSDAVHGHDLDDPRADLAPSRTDSAPHVPKSVVTDPRFDWGDDAPPRVPASETVIYEAHVKGLTRTHPGIDPALAGTFGALADDAMLEHYARLGITTLELLPIHAIADERFLLERGLRNYWGYQAIGFFAPAARYMATTKIAEIQSTIRRLHAAGIEVILDVVYNHTGEGNELGPTLSFRGLDNASYYRLADDRRYYINDTGTGNTLNVAHPMVLRMVMDSLRYWVETFHVDGFRFDLATVLAREAGGFDPNGGFLDAIRQDPVLSRVKLIAEPWDVGPGGYQLGNWPHPFMEWNDRYRDGVRRFWRGDAHMIADLSRRLLGSADEFDHSGRAATSSVNFVTAHDGFTLHDLTSFATRHNEANGEDNRDGHSANFSDNLGTEGPSDDPDITAARALRKRNLLATLMLSQGTPMLLAGDEIGNSQSGNNNAYAQDNPTGWVDWSDPDTALLDFTARLIALRRAHPVLRQRRFLHSRPRPRDGLPDLFWRLPDGAPPTGTDWRDPDRRALCVEIRTSSTTPDYAASEDVVFAVFNAGDAVAVTLPDCPAGQVWQQILDTTDPEGGRIALHARVITAPASSVLAFTRTADEKDRP